MAEPFTLRCMNLRFRLTASLKQDIVVKVSESNIIHDLYDKLSGGA